MRVIVVGFGTQGKKRYQLLHDKEKSFIVDPIAVEAAYKTVGSVPLDDYDAAFVCVPDQEKFSILTYLLLHHKHVLVEKPLVFNEKQLRKIQDLSQHSVCYTAYNHRFEPHFIRMKDVIDSGVLGKIYSCRLFYGNGTALDVKGSPWRDQGYGVIHDLGSHLLDTVLFWFENTVQPFTLMCKNVFENRAPDHAILWSNGHPFIELEMTLLSWRNSFSCTILAEHGSAHIDSLCKWGPSTFTLRRRTRPSGRPNEESVVLVKNDPTWSVEQGFFRTLCTKNVGWNNLENDQWIQQNLPH